MSDLNISVDAMYDKEFGYSVAFNFSHRIKSFGLTDEKAEAFANNILKKVQEIRELRRKS